MHAQRRSRSGRSSRTGSRYLISSKTISSPLTGRAPTPRRGRSDRRPGGRSPIPAAIHPHDIVRRHADRGQSPVEKRRILIERTDDLGAAGSRQFGQTASACAHLASAAA